MARTLKRVELLLLAFVSGSVGCGSGSNGIRAGAGGTGGFVGTGTGGIGTDGAATGGIGSGGTGSGNPAADGGFGTGGAAPDGGGSGGLATGGLGSGGARSGGSGSGGFATGGLGSGGARSGGSGSGGFATGGLGSGGARTGGSGSGSGGIVGTGGKATGGVVGTGGYVTGGAVGTGGYATGGAVGTGGAYLDVNSHTMDFGAVAVGSTSVSIFTLVNQGGMASGVPMITVQGDDATSVTVAGCSAALPPNASCPLTIRATPSTLGLFQASVRILANPGTEMLYGSYLSITVVGHGSGFEISSPTSVDLGQVAPGVLVKHTITVSALIALSDLEVWTTGDEVSVDASGTTCTATLAAGASCVVTVGFVASSIGWKRDTVGFKAGGDYGQVVNVEITATVSKSSDLAIEPKTPQSFVGFFDQTSPPVVFTVTNLASAASGTITATIVGGNARDFKVASTDCTSLAPQSSCTVAVVCALQMSASAATRHAVLSVTDGNTQLSVPLSAEVSFRAG